MEDRSKHEVKNELRLLKLSDRVTRGLCLECGTDQNVTRALCMECRKLPRYQELLKEEEGN